MTCADTNVVVRFLVADDPDQHARARALLGAGGVVLPLTVMLEAEWVLRSNDRYAQPELVAAMREVASLPGVVVEAADRVRRALDLAEAGLDLADAVHLASVPPGAVFVTFDRDLLRRAQALGLPAQEP